MERVVAVCRIELLPSSETFIVDQLRSYSSWSAKIFGQRKVDGLDIAPLKPIFLGLSSRLWIKSIYERVLRRLSLPDFVAVYQLRRSHASLVHIHFATDAVSLWPTLKWLGLPLVVTLHGYDITIYKEFWENGLGGHIRTNYPKALLAMARSPMVSFVAVSNAIRDRAIEFGIPSKSIFVKYIGLDLTRFSIAGDPLSKRPQQVLFIGRLVEKKGVAYLIRAFEIVLQTIPDAQLVIIGDGPLRPDLEILARELGPAVNFMGYQTSTEIRKQLSLSRLFCLASVRAENGDAEGLPIVLLEAQAAGVPAITSAHGGAMEAIIEGVTGMAFREGDSTSLAEIICGLLNDDVRLDAMSDAARAFISERFNIVNCTAELEDLYADLTRRIYKRWHLR